MKGAKRTSASFSDVLAKLTLMTIVLSGVMHRTALAQSDCARLSEDTDKQLSLMAQYHSADNSPQRRILWLDISRGYDSLIRDYGAVSDSDDCTLQTQLHYTVADGVYAVLSIANGTGAVNAKIVNSTIGELTEAKTLRLSSGVLQTLDHSHDLDTYADVPGFDEQFFRWVVHRAILLDVNNRYSMSTINEAYTDFLDYWDPSWRTYEI